MLTGINEVAEQLIKIDRVFADRLGKRVTARHVVAHFFNERSHFRLVDTFGDNFEGLNQRYTRTHHRRHLAREQRNVTRCDGFTATKRHTAGFLLYLFRDNALLAQFGFCQSWVQA